LPMQRKVNTSLIFIACSKRPNFYTKSAHADPVSDYDNEATTPYADYSLTVL